MKTDDGLDAATAAVWLRPATSEQMAELAELAGEAGEDVPSGMRASEAEQRLEELRRVSAKWAQRRAAARPPVTRLPPL